MSLVIISLTVFHILAILLTVVRIQHRLWTRGLRSDDLFASLAVLLNLGYIGTLWFERMQHSVVVLLLSFVIVWSARIALALTISRLYPTKHVIRRAAFCLALALGALFTTVFAQHAVVCITGPCHRQLNLKIVVAVCNAIALILLLLAPVVVLCTSPPPSKRPLFLAILFAACLMGVSSGALAVFHFILTSPDKPQKKIRQNLPHLDIAVSIIACNLPFAIVYIYAFLKPGRNLEDLTDYSPTSRNSSTQPSLVLTEITDAWTTAPQPVFQDELSPQARSSTHIHN